MKYKKLFIFSNEFPYGKSESYMENEMPYFENFGKVYIISLQIKRKNRNIIRTTPKNFEIVPVYLNVPAYILYGLRAIGDLQLYKEVKRLIKSKRLSLRSLFELLVYVSRSHYESDYIKSYLHKRNISISDSVFYSYRFGYQPYVACLLSSKLKENIPIISRAHRYDLYENRKKTGYIPMRSYILEKIKFCYPVSNDGTDYLRKCYPTFSKKIQTRYLGTIDHGYIIPERQVSFRIVSCSNVVTVKRIELIIDSLSLIKNHDIIWTHYGSGQLFEEMKKYAVEKLPSNIKVEWKGYVSNLEVLNGYKDDKYNLFINVSISEGIPVSIMEAGSFSIPCVATSAGGTGELIIDKVNGYLLPVETTAENVASSICDFIEMSEKNYIDYCMNSRNIWEENFSANRNYIDFINEISEL